MSARASTMSNVPHCTSCCNARLFAAFVISFIARGLYSHTNHKICYSAVSSGGIVLTLPGFAVSECMLGCQSRGHTVDPPDLCCGPPVSAALELSNKTMLTGSLKLVWAIFQALFIGFVQTLGSDLWLRLDRRARAQRLAMMEDITHTIYSKGLLTANWTARDTSNPISLSFVHTLEPNTAYDQYNYIGVGCYRGAHWPWYLRGPKWIWTIPFVPIFAFLLALWNLQAFKSKKDVKNILIMVTFGCVSFAGESLGSNQRKPLEFMHSPQQTRSERPMSMGQSAAYSELLQSASLAVHIHGYVTDTRLQPWCPVSCF